MSDECIQHHDWFNTVLTYGLCFGLVVSYLPQHLRIIMAKSSEGISAVFLFLGVASTSSSMFNMITLQAPIVRCCRVVSFGSCMEMSAGVIQMTLQWICFSAIFILYMIYYPEYLKYVVRTSEEVQLLSYPKEPVRSENWRMSIILAWSAAAHCVFAAFVTAYLLLYVPDSPTGIRAPQIATWATFLGVSSALLAMVQYTPQLLHTFRLKHVGALSIPMMMIQTPGGILMVVSVALRPGTDWTSWITFLFSAILQGILLAMCIVWKIRQRRLRVDDFGRPMDPQPYVLDEPASVISAPDDYPIIVREDTARSVDEPVAEEDEETPLLRRRERAAHAQGEAEAERGWSAWFGR
ncbi:hypothetical protein HYPSUDRAFT_81319 [Hypholoma sublateritium FD-334 SS-4]|uniref:PQ-loop repeat-containing protein n=1 Tax=Hypholoma sublateritium (strain FD-334 SS-4) TaxID=945553 RepID=A0A0D2PN66_HYPSF|nr:hypothetical protein HYPSUDRAFT_81319 [Hypholoma sublateritium FD-334 SS-4]